MTSHIETLVQQLDGKADESYEARAELIRTGADAIPAEWAAMAPATLEIDGAIEPLRRAYCACLERATPPDWTESRSKSPADGLCWKPPEPPSATTSSSSPTWIDRTDLRPER